MSQDRPARRIRALTPLGWRVAKPIGSMPGGTSRSISLTNRLRDALASISPALKDAVGSRLTRGGARDLLAKYSTPTALRASSGARITKTNKTRSPRLAPKLTDSVLTTLNAQTVTLLAETTIGPFIAEPVGKLDRLHKRRKTLVTEMEEVFLAHPLGELLTSPSGIRPRTGARILAEIGAGTRFSSDSKLASDTSLAPLTGQSGKPPKCETNGRRGNYRLKNAMVPAAFGSLRNPDSKAFYDRKRAEGNKHYAPLTCLACHRCEVILAMVRNR